MSQPAAAGSADVEIVSAYKSYGDVAAVDGVDLLVRAGEFFTMLGPSGSGKTTTLRLIAGFERPDSGRILLGGDDVTKVPPYARDVNTVFQDYALFPHMTVAANVEYGLRVKKVPRAERKRRVGEALEMVRLGAHGGRKPGQLSGGQRQRVALARAIVNRPKVLLLDEPLGALDLKLRQDMQIELKRIQEEVGITFIYVTHDQEEALTMSDRMAVFNEGRIEQVGAPAAVYEHPESEFVAGFVGVSNVLERTYNGTAEPLHGAAGEDSPARGGRAARERVERRGRRDQGRGLRRNGHALRGRPRRGRTADGRAPEPGDVLERGARGPRPPGATGVAAGTHLRNRIGGRDG